MSGRVDVARRWLAGVDGILLGSGAGLTAAAGFDYTDPQWFAENFAPMLRYGYLVKAT